MSKPSETTVLVTGASGFIASHCIIQLLEKGTVAREEDIEGAEANVRGLEGRVVEANLQLSDATLKAPYDGHWYLYARWVDHETHDGQAIFTVVAGDQVREVVVDQRLHEHSEAVRSH